MPDLLKNARKFDLQGDFSALYQETEISRKNVSGIVQYSLKRYRKKPDGHEENIEISKTCIEYSNRSAQPVINNAKITSEKNLLDKIKSAIRNLF